MITTSEMYWLTRLDAIHNLFGEISAISVVIVLCAGALGLFLFLLKHFAGNKSYELFSHMKDETFEATKARFGRIARGCLFVVFACVATLLLTDATHSLLPTTKEMAAILIVPKIANNEKVQDCGNRLYDLAVEWMDALKPKKEAISETTNK